MNQALKPTGEVVKSWQEFWYSFEVERLTAPFVRGAGERTHRLWANGSPALGGQWHYNLDSAVARAEYVLQRSYASRISWLEQRVNTLERELHQAIKRELFAVSAYRQIAPPPPRRSEGWVARLLRIVWRWL